MPGEVKLATVKLLRVPFCAPSALPVKLVQLLVTAPVAPALPTPAACPKCDVMLVPVQLKHAGVIGGLLVVIGIIGCFLNLVGGLALVGLGVVVSAVGYSEPGLMCPNCGAQAATLGDLARKVTTPPGRAIRILAKVAEGVGWVVLVIAVCGLLYMIVESLKH